MTIRQLFYLVCMTLPGCVSNQATGEAGSSDRTQTMVLDCPGGLAKCYSSAKSICGPRGFDELDRARDGFLTATGRLDQQRDGRHVYREDLRFEGDNQTLVIRCK